MVNHSNQSNSFTSYTKALKKLTPREIEVLDLIEKGFLNKEIAREMNISIRTVHAHRRNIYDKLALRGRHAITKWLWMAKNSVFEDENK